MKPMLKFIFLFLFHLVLIMPSLILAGTRDEVFSKANTYYQAKDYDNALKTYQQLLSKENPSAELLYNIGNCYFKTGNLGKSVLYYERALKLNPDDEDIGFNLRIANLKTVDKIEPVPPIIYKRWIKSVSEALTMSQWSVAVILWVWLMFVSWSFYLFANSVNGKKTGFVLASIASAFCLISFLFLNENYRIQNRQEYSVVMAASSYVKSAPDERGNDQFILHEGTKVEVLDELGSWKKIRLANGSVGWLKTADVEEI